MSVVTAFRNVRGVYLSFAHSSTKLLLVYSYAWSRVLAFCCILSNVCYPATYIAYGRLIYVTSRNNSLRASMVEISLPSAIIASIINDPSLLSRAFEISLPDEQALHVLEHGYERGFKKFFLINASLGVLATIVSATIIKHKELTREDDVQLKLEAKAGLKKACSQGSVSEHDVEAGIADDHDEKDGLGDGLKA